MWKEQGVSFRRSHRCADCLRPAHFSDHDDVYVLTKRGAKRRIKITRVNTHLALVNDTFVFFKNIFYRIFNGNDVLRARVVNLVIIAASVVDFPAPQDRR